MLRRSAILALLVAAAGCSSGKSSRSGGRSRRPKGPKTMGNLLVDAYVADLKKGSPEKKISAAKELAAMGPNAKSALPALQSLSSDKNSKVSAAAQAAIKAIKK